MCSVTWRCRNASLLKNTIYLHSVTVMATEAHLSSVCWVYWLETSFHTRLRSTSTSTIKWRGPASAEWDHVRAARTLRETERRISGCLWLSIIIPFSDLCVKSLKKPSHFPPPSKAEPKAPSRDRSTSPRTPWVIDPLGQVISLARSPANPPTNLPRSLISSYLSPGMQPFILKNTLSCNTLEKALQRT